MTDKENVYSLGLIGHPLEHSLSPRLHHAALAGMALEGKYRLYPIPPFPQGKPAMIELLDLVRSGKLHGLNVTIPHKQNVMGYLDEISPEARSIGAVNTVYYDGDGLWGDNTDAPGFLTDLAQLTGENLDKSGVQEALILGAGGSARAVTYALLGSGWRVRIAARRIGQAHELVKCFHPTDFKDWISAHDIDGSSLETIKTGTKLIVNATPVGMWPHVDDNPWPKGVSLPADAKVYDLVYNPPETDLMRTARAAGLSARNGLGMLVEQAALALERWTDMLVPRGPMWMSVNEFVNTEYQKG
jgi:shikimate dehydrogenase